MYAYNYMYGPWTLSNSPKKVQKNKWNEASNCFAGISMEILMENKMQTISRDTMRYINSAYVQRPYGKCVTQECKVDAERRRHTSHPIE